MTIPPKKAPVYRVALIGGGRQGTVHARAYQLHPRTEVVAVADTDPENLKLFCERFSCKGYATWDEMFRHEKIDISAPNLPVRANPGAVIASAKAGVRAVFSEKPLAGTLADADAMVEACAARNIPFAAGLVASSHPDYQKAYAMAASGEIGEIVRINLFENNKQVGTHGLNIVRKFANKSEVDFVIGWVSGDARADQEDDFGDGKAGFGAVGGYIRFKNGIECFSGYQPGENKQQWRSGVEVVGTCGVIFNANNTALTLRLYRAKSAAPPKSWDDLEEVKGAFQYRDTPENTWDGEGWRNPGPVLTTSIDQVVAAIDTGKPLGMTTGDDLRHSLEIAIALRESARNGHAPVKLPIKDRSIVMLPQRSRWFYKKEVHGEQWYREAMQTHIRPVKK